MPIGGALGQVKRRRVGIGQNRQLPAATTARQVGRVAEQGPPDAAADPGRFDIEQDQLDRLRARGAGDLVQADRPIFRIGRDEHVASPDRGGVDRQSVTASFEERGVITPMGLGAQAQVGQGLGFAGIGRPDRQDVRRARDQFPCSRATARQPMSRRQKPSGQRIASTAW